MKKLLAIAAVSVIAAAAVAFQPPMGADIARDFIGCGVWDAAGMFYVVTDGHNQLVQTNNDKGIWNYYCQGQLPEGATLPDRAGSFVPEGVTCLGNGSFRQVVTPSGNFTTVCKGRP